MQHYTEEQWIKYNNGGFSKAESALMENHLINCDLCMEIFLSLISEEDIQKAELLIPHNFTDTTMNYIKEQSYKTSPKVKSTKKHNKKSNLFTYYAATAVLTIVFMGGGLFQALVDNTSSISQAVLVTDKKALEINLNISQQIVSKTSNFIMSIESIE